MSSAADYRSAMLVLRNCIAAGVLVLALGVGSVSAFTYVTDANGTWWGIQDAASPGVDTGSIRGTQIAAGQSGALSTSINGFGGIRVFVDATPAPRFNGELMRGFGLTFDGVDRFRTTQSVNVGGVTISRAIFINRSANWGRWLDTFTNTTKAPLTIKVAFGGQSGLGATGSNSSSIVNTSNGDAKVAPGDAWVAVATPLDSNKPDTMIGGPQITVTGSFDFAGNWLHDTFATPLSYTGHEGNFQAYVNSITLPPGKSRSLLHFIVLGQRVNAASSAGVRAALEATAAALAASPELGGLTPGEICTIANFDTPQSNARPPVRRPMLWLNRPRRRRSQRAPGQDTTWSRRRSASCAPTWRPASRPRRRSRARISTGSRSTTRASSASTRTRSSPPTRWRRPGPPTRARAGGPKRAAAGHPDRRQEQLRHARTWRRPTAASRSRTSGPRRTPSRWQGCAKRAP